MGRAILLLGMLGSATYACGTLDREPNDDYNGLRNQRAISVSSSDAGACEAIDAGACSVSFSNVIMPLFEATGCWTGCHFDTYDPRMKKDDLFTWNSLRKHVHPTLKKPYINACSTDLNASYIVANLKGEMGAGERMPRGPLPYTPEQIQKVEDWVRCGAPFN
jgi:hypothetical protein